jgi:NitT/TauT family transport system substrate-binding protein
MPIEQPRRRFLSQLAIAGVAGMGGLASAGLSDGARSFAAEPPPEITTIRLGKNEGICPVPQYVAEELLRSEGFTDIRYPTIETSPARAVAHSQVDWDMEFTPNVIHEVDNGAALTMVSGIHVGCYELVAHEHVRSIAGLRGRTVGFSPDYVPTKVLVALMAKFVGLDPDKDIHWVGDLATDPMDLFVDRKIDAFLAAPPETNELRARKLGHSLVNSATDRPWSQYYCCMLTGRTEFIRKYPAATKRIVRSYLRATDLCVNEPERMARSMVDRGFAARYDYALETLRELPYGVWRDFDPEDTVRFFALRMNEAGFSKSSPQQIITGHTNWRFLNEVKRELKV